MNKSANNNEPVRSNDVTGTQDINRFSEGAPDTLASAIQKHKNESDIEDQNKEDGMYSSNLKSPKIDQEQNTKPEHPSKNIAAEDNEGDGGMTIDLGTQSDILDQ